MMQLSLDLVGIVNDNNDSSLVWFIVGILAIIALLIYIIGRFPHR